MESILTQEKWEHSEPRYREIFEHSLDMMSLLEIGPTLELICLEANPALYRRLARAQDEVIGKAIGQVLTLEVANIVEAICLHCIDVAGPVELDTQLPCGAQPLYVHFNLVPLKDEAGELRRIVCIARDFTDLREVQRKERERQQEIGTLVENSPDGIARLNKDRRLLYVNPTLEQWLNQPKEDLLHRLLDEVLWPGAQSRMLIEAIAEAVEGGRTVQHEYVRQRSRREQRVFQISLVPEWDMQGRLTSLLAVIRDISILRNAQRSLASSNAQLHDLLSSRENAREEERKLIAREIHDELGQYLTAIRMGISLLRFQYGAQLPALGEQVGNLLQLSDRTVQVVRNVSNSLRPSALNMGLAASLEWLTDEFTRQWSMPCTLDLPAQLPILNDADATAVFRVAQESLTNVARHANASRVDITLTHEGERWLLQIVDDGQGFELRNLGGKTLGLFGMRERALMLGGCAEISSMPGSGTAVRLWIPDHRSA
ncbi:MULTISPECIES: PAS domain-containing protein [Pseudomonas syringae group]|uniref:PAS domain-containing protein n=2 Tax=Pseudomonas syringae group TaxID=136849 RepID=A0ABX6HAA9_9PSED|nr:PAS domain-containing protein [Pseudomonas asturiensis]QHF02314.1 PAS domain-containing protein [Pseudomonas asturiensis]